MAWDASRWKLDLRTGLTVTTCALGIYGAYRLLQNRAILCDNVSKLLRTIRRTVCPPKKNKQNRLIVHVVRICGGICIATFIVIVTKRFRTSFTTKPSIAIGAFSLMMLVRISCGFLTSTQEEVKPSGQSTIEQKVVNGNLCVIAADQHTLSTIAEQVRQATDGLYSVKEHLVTNRKAVADLPIYTRAICCALNAERNISFDREGNPEPDADLGFRAFDRMDAYTGKKSGVLLLLFDHYKSHDISELYSMAGFNPSQRLRDTAEDGRFLTVYRELNDKQIDRIKKIF